MNQKEQILSYLKAGNSITPLEALQKFGCFRLGARIWELKKDGYPVEVKTVYDKVKDKHYASYFLPEQFELKLK